MNVPALDVYSRDAILAHVWHTLSFYRQRAFDPSGGFYQFFKNDGTIYDRRTRHLVSSTRYVFLWAMAARHFDEPEFRQYTRHAVNFVRTVHRRPETGGYAWQLRWEDGACEVLDATNHCYGLAFVLLAYAHAVQAGIDEARPWLAETFALMEQHFWQASYQLYADEADEQWTLRSYRGQNANMHSVEAALAAFDATREQRFLDRAATIAEAVVQRLTRATDGLIWEHYRADWTPDWEYNRNDRTNIFRPWGYQPGHLAEWAKLLVLLEHRRPLPWLLPRAQALFAAAVRHGWDNTYGGLYYGFAPDFSVYDDDKYHWVQCETLAAAALLGARTRQNSYWERYESLWGYCWRHWVDHRHGAWFRIMTRDNRNLTDEKSPAGKVDYHTTGACYDILSALAARSSTL